MNLSFHTAVVGAQQQQQRLNIQGNNIANVNNYGFKAKKASFQALMYRNIRGIDNAELPVGVGAQVISAATDFTSGTFASTGRDLDYAIQGDGFFAVVNPVTNELTFTRTGAFALSEFLVAREDENGEQELDEEGQPIMETVYRLADAEGRFVLSEEGRVMDVKDPSQTLSIGVFDFINYNGMQHQGYNRFLPTDKNGQLRLGTGRVTQGILELSNVDLAEEMTKVIESQRAYGMALKMIQTSDEVETTINGLRS